MKNSNLGQLEKKVMDILWEHKEGTTRNVLEKLPDKLAYTTVATILQRLSEKKLLKKQLTKNGYIYKPSISKDIYTKQIANKFLSKFIGSYGDTAITSFADSVGKLPEDKKKYFMELLEGYDKNK